VPNDSAPRLHEALERILSGHDLDTDAAEAAMGEIMSGRATEGRVAGYLVALRMKGETADEVVGSARAMRAAGTRIAPRRDVVVDTCGTGGDGSGTFNISTAAALVAAATDLAVAKHGNRSVSSRCGSADVVAALGIPIDGAPAEVESRIERLGFGFLMAPAFHAAIRHAMPARISLATRTVFNLLGPLVNPAQVRRQVMGVFSEDVLELAAGALAGLGTEHAFVVHSADGLDEVSLADATHVVAVLPSGPRRFTVPAADFGVESAPLDALAGGSASDNATILTAIFDGERGPRRDAVVVNAALALCAGGLEADLRAAARRAEATLDSGAVRRLLDRLRSDGP
jgi:anthranilate phosphoribosyltransferase